MPVAVSVVICAAGMGTRLGLNLPKALVEVGGRPLIRHQLDLTSEVEDVVVVVGYRAGDVIDEVLSVRRDITIAFNHEFATTGTAASLAIGARVGHPTILSLDGDLLVAREDFYHFFTEGPTLLGLVPSQSTKPVWAHLNGRDQVVDLSQEVRSGLEWSGFTRLSRERAGRLGRGHVYQGLRQALPADYRMIDCCEVDDPPDLDLANTWLEDRRDAAS